MALKTKRRRAPARRARSVSVPFGIRLKPEIDEYLIERMGSRRSKAQLIHDILFDLKEGRLVPAAGVQVYYL